MINVIGEFVIWWLTRSLIAWGIWCLVTLFGLVWFAVKDEESMKALDMICEEGFPEKSKPQRILRIIAEFVLWPAWLIISSVELIRIYNRLIELRNRLYEEGTC